MGAGRIALTTAWASLALAAPAAAQADSALPVPAPSAESSATAPAEPAQAPVVAAATHTVETVNPAGAVETVRAAVSSKPPTPPPPPPHEDSAPTEPTRTSTTTNATRSAPSSHPAQQISGLVEEVRTGSSGLVEEVQRTASRTVAPAIERTTQMTETDALVRSTEETLRHLPLGGEQVAKTVGSLSTSLSKATAPVRETLAGPLDSLVDPTTAALLPPGGQAVEASPSSAFASLNLTAGAEPASSYPTLGSLGNPSIASWLEPNILALTELQLLTSADHDGPGSEQPLTPGRSPVGEFVAVADDLQTPGPLNAPMPTPESESPGAAAPASGGSFFVPLAALLALLALAAPATRRRLSEVPGFPAPTPFVCALERPG